MFGKKKRLDGGSAFPIASYTCHYFLAIRRWRHRETAAGVSVNYRSILPVAVPAEPIPGWIIHKHSRWLTQL